ncbi:MAG: hypothetical protein WBV77_01240, partial [Solirubrobacteraceae bacterium]
PVTDALVLAAAERAERHQARSEPGVMPREVFEHMGFVYNAAATRQLRPRLDGLMEAGLLEHARRSSVRLWVLTSAGRLTLAQARHEDEAVALPESPQHRKWRHSHAKAAERIERYREELRALLGEAETLLAADTRAHSDMWFCLANRLPGPATSIGAAIYCLTEWPEPSDTQPDIEDYSDPRDDSLKPEERQRRRSLRTGRRHVLRGEIV